jgi:CBS domain-containing protein
MPKNPYPLIYANSTKALHQQENIMPTAVSEVMTRDVTVISPDDNVLNAAKMMADWDVGVLPVCTGKHLAGVITDRDITIRAVPTGKAASDIRVSEAMSDGVFWLFDDQTVGEALQQMGAMQVRRLPVVARQSMELVGIVSIGDLAARADAHVDPAMEEISMPSEPSRHAPH